MDDLKQLFKLNYLKYASYVILDRAIPDVVDGLKPVQRRILYTLYLMDDGKLHKVANVAGQTMAFHPHGDGPITEALVNLANKSYLLDRQGNFGNLYTGDPAAAARYIETRLSPLARETLFNKDITKFLLSYDSRHEEPITLPSKLPILLMQGAEGIAVGMSTKILPHNFKELLEAEIAILENKPFKILPDFPTGGIMDASEYQNGKGKIKLRAKLNIRDEKTIAITEICYGTTTESLIRSIDDAAKKGKIKIDSINDYTAEKVEIEIKLPRGQYAQTIINALYAFTDCEVTHHSQMVVIRDKIPWEASVDEILKYNVELLVGYLQLELEIERDRLIEKIFEKTLEQIFIENRLYKKIEEIKSYEKVHETISTSLKPFHEKLTRIPTEDDRERLLSIPIRRISRFDIERNLEEIKAIEEKLSGILKNLKDINKFTIKYLQTLINKYGKFFNRTTKIQEIEELDVKAIATRKMKVSYDAESGYLGTKITSDHFVECTNFDKLLILFQDGTYTVTNIPEKKYMHQQAKVAWIGLADKETVISVIYHDPATKYDYAKRFVIKQFILDKIYNFIEPDCQIKLISSQNDISLEFRFKPKERQKVSNLIFMMNDVAVKGVSAKGIRIANKEVLSIKMVQVDNKE